MRPVNRAICVVILAIGVTGAAAAPAGGTPAALEVKQQGAVTFVSGGVGDEELQAIRKLAPAYTLELLFASKGSPSEYLADIKVQVKDKNGSIVLDAVSQGPFLLAKLAPGKYSISADFDGAPMQKSIQVTDGKLHHLDFIW